MTLQEQKKTVARLAELAAERSAAASRRRAAFRRWKQRTFGSPQMLAWMFAAGAVCAAAGTDASNDRSRAKRLAMGVANLGLLGWRFLGRSESAPQDPAPSRPEGVTVDAAGPE
jgi:hypothetical protein